MTEIPVEAATEAQKTDTTIITIHAGGHPYRIVFRDYVNADELAEMLHYRIERHARLIIADTEREEGTESNFVERFADIFHYAHPNGNQTALKVADITGYEITRL